MDNNLLPCPFCGGAAKMVIIDFSNNNSDLPDIYNVQCTKCHADASVCLNADEAAAAWNQRVDHIGEANEMIKPNDDNGLYAKYRVYKNNSGEPVENCFVLQPEKDPAAVEALRVYAGATTNKQLAEDILSWIARN